MQLVVIVLHVCTYVYTCMCFYRYSFKHATSSSMHIHTLNMSCTRWTCSPCRAAQRVPLKMVKTYQQSSRRVALKVLAAGGQLCAVRVCRHANISPWCMYMCVHMYICLHMYIFTHTCIYIHIYMYLCRCKHKPLVNADVYTHVYIYVELYVHEYV